MSFIKRSVFLAAAALIALAGCAVPYGDPYGTAYPGGTTYPTYPAAGYPTYPDPETARYGYVESVDTIDADRQRTGPGLGALGGAVAGGIVGHQIGSGSGNTAATIGGAVIGGVIGHQVEQTVRNRQGAAGVEYVFRVRMDDGSYQTFRKETHDNIQVGDRVRVERGNVFRV
ncbi:MAG TPA: glycine zipper 2TM domain-containing protein [Burkholderiales bacterium]|nr:glycine zipper 2TM domain-containing protein [Burkholderiales bacterium]